MNNNMKLPIISGKRLLKILLKNGHQVIRQRGSHVLIRKYFANLQTVIPVHANEELGRGMLKSILNDLDLSVEDLLALMQ